jgi:dephospho-CoA kinase
LLAGVRQGFGDAVFDARGKLLRRELGRIVFADPARLQELNRLVYPRLAVVLEERLAALGNRPLAVLDAALIFEWGIEDHCNEVWVIQAADDVRIRRLVESRGLGESEAGDRLASQMAAQDKALRAHRVIGNEGSVAQFVQRLRDEAAPLFAGLGLTLREESGT